MYTTAGILLAVSAVIATAAVQLLLAQGTGAYLKGSIIAMALIGAAVYCFGKNHMLKEQAQTNAPVRPVVTENSRRQARTAA